MWAERDMTMLERVAQLPRSKERGGRRETRVHARLSATTHIPIVQHLPEMRQLHALLFDPKIKAPRSARRNKIDVIGAHLQNGEMNYWFLNQASTANLFDASSVGQRLRRWGRSTSYDV